MFFKKATEIDEIFTVKVHIFWEGHKILQNFMAFSEHMNFISLDRFWPGRGALTFLW